MPSFSLKQQEHANTSTQQQSPSKNSANSSIANGPPSYAELLGLSKPAQNPSFTSGGSSSYSGKSECLNSDPSMKNNINTNSNQGPFLTDKNSNISADSEVSFHTYSFQIGPANNFQEALCFNINGIRLEEAFDTNDNNNNGPETATSLETNAKSDSVCKTDSNTFISILRYAVNELATKIDPTVVVQVYGPESPGTITDDGVRCKHGNISFFGKQKSCLEIKTQLAKTFEFTQRIKYSVPISLELTNDKMGQVKQLEEQITNEYDVEMTLIEPKLKKSSFNKGQSEKSSSHDSVETAFFEVTGKYPVISRVVPIIQQKLDVIKGFAYECIQLNSAKSIVAFLGPQKKGLLNLMLEHNVRITFDSSCMVTSTRMNQFQFILPVLKQT